VRLSIDLLEDDLLEDMAKGSSPQSVQKHKLLRCREDGGLRGRVGSLYKARLQVEEKSLEFFRGGRSGDDY